jgi:hypothetical protein
MPYSRWPANYAMQRLSRLLFDGEQIVEAGPARWQATSPHDGWLAVTSWRAFWLDDRPTFTVQMPLHAVKDVRTHKVLPGLTVQSEDKQAFNCSRAQAQAFVSAIRRNLLGSPPTLPAVRAVVGPTGTQEACSKCGEWQWGPEDGYCPTCLAPFDLTDEATRRYVDKSRRRGG